MCVYDYMCVCLCVHECVCTSVCAPVAYLDLWSYLGTWWAQWLEIPILLPPNPMFIAGTWALVTRAHTSFAWVCALVGPGVATPLVCTYNITCLYTACQFGIDIFIIISYHFKFFCYFIIIRRKTLLIGSWRIIKLITFIIANTMNTFFSTVM